MPDYKVKVTYIYPVSAVDARDAFNTVSMVIKAKFAGFHGEDITEIINAKGEVVLKAELVTTKKK